ncbi:hypothetical protein COV93_08210 [Candidatus Woesearchaeota archaeon CG11_big_fil_rev_8_21_14_0_20_43_8]|nr:MAG: hypothetical protein COV93_08210 [Candidatus Woesearchaeota archaeon CG11_big_fil_rev_8_21_14_0_20_43_8]
MSTSVFAASGLTDYTGTTALSISLINQDPDPAVAGNIIDIRIGLENIGGIPAKDIIFELMPEYPFQALPGDNMIQNVGSIKSYQDDDNMKILKYRVRTDKDITAGTYDLKGKYYMNGSNVVISKTLPIEVESRESAEVIYIDKFELIPGKITLMKFTINNVGATPLRELTFQWENADDIILPVGSDNTKYIKYIDVGDSAELEFNVIASATADPDLYKIDLTLTYTDPITGSESEITTKAGIYVGGATDFDIAFSGTSNGESSFAVSNIGSVSASSVTVRIPDQKGWSVTGSNSVIIGNLNEGDYTIASFTLKQTAQSTGQFNRTRPTGFNNTDAAAMKDRGGFQRSGAAPSAGDGTTVTLPMATGNVPIVVEIAYTDSRGTRNVIQKNVTVDVGTSSTAATAALAGMAGRRTATQQTLLQQIWTRGKWIGLGVIIIIMLTIVNRKYKKGKLSDPDYTLWKVLTGKKKGKR